MRTDSLVAVGDLMLGDSPVAVGYGWRSRYPGDLAFQALARLTRVLSGADIAFGNLEVQLTSSGYGRSRRARDMMRGDPAYAGVLRRLGFNVLAVANNHAMQHGESAFQDTVSLLRHEGIDVAGLRGSDGWNAKPVVKTTTAGTRVGILAYSLRPRQYGTGDPSYASGPEPAILVDAERLASQVDRLVVSLHWGEEFTATPSKSETRFATELSEIGVHLLVGHHPHVVRPVVRLGTTHVAYSLGNAVSDMIWQPQFRRGIALRCNLTDVAAPCDIMKIETDAAYKVHATGEWKPVAPDVAVAGLDAAQYTEAIEDSMRSYRRATLRHMLRNVWRGPPQLTFQLFIEKARNLSGRILR